MSALTWQVPGDLDPALSPHHLTTHKAAYLKLRFLVDAGAIFVGHGLKKDFRMLNIVVPPAQARPCYFLLSRQRLFVLLGARLHTGPGSTTTSTPASFTSCSAPPCVQLMPNSELEAEDPLDSYTF